MTFQADANPKPTTARVLLVDDHADTLALLARALTKFGYQVLTADSCAAALATPTASFDLLITDLELGDGNGSRLCTDLRRTRPNLPAIAVTGHGVQAGDLPHFSAHLVKPIQFDTLIATIQRVLQV